MDRYEHARLQDARARVRAGPVKEKRRKATPAFKPAPRPEYPGLPKNHEGEHGVNQSGHHFTLSQASESYEPPIPWQPWHWGNWYWWHIAVVTLDDGTFLAHDARFIPDSKGWGIAGGFFTYNRRFPTRDAALRANCAEIVRMARRWARTDPVALFDRRMPADVAQQMIDWAFQIAGQDAPTLHIGEAPPPPPKVEADGQIRMF